MKKLLALVLALVMVMGLATVGANAASTKYADADKINYKEAVDVLSEIGILGGDASGFRPTDNLKRSEGAKIVAYLLLGNKAADALQGSGNRFTDLPANHWAAGYMEYLAAVGVMGGTGDGKIDPDGTLTVVQFAKMLLTALGYDAQVENLGGPDWAINTQRLATSVELFDGNSSVTPTAAITREEAALYALNTLKTPLVEYSNKGSSIAVNGATINLGASKAEYVTSTIAKEQTIDDTQLTNSNNYTIEFAERYYKDLVQKTGETDAFERPAVKWTWKNKSIGTYADDPTLTYTTEFKIGTLYADLGLTDGIAASKVTYYMDGENVTDVEAQDVVKGDRTEWGGKGSVTEIYYKASAGTIRVVQVNTYVAKVGAVYAATTTKDAYVTIKVAAADRFTRPYAGSATTYETTEFKKDDIVTYTYSMKNGEDEIKSMSATEKVEGVLSGFTVSGGVSLDNGSKYRLNDMSLWTTLANAVTDDDDAELAVGYINDSVGRAAKVYLDEYGYAVYVDATASTQYAVALGYSEGNSLDGARAKLLFTDGTTKTVAVANKAAFEATSDDFEDNTADDKIGKYDIVAYTINSNDKYVCTLASDVTNSRAGAELIKSGRSRISTLTTTIDGNQTGNISSQLATATADKVINNADGGTTFLVVNTDHVDGSTTYEVYKGIANVPTVTVDAGQTTKVTIFQKNSDTYATVIFIARTADVNFGSSNSDVVFVKGEVKGQSYTKDLGYFYDREGFVNGEAKTVMLSTEFEDGVVGDMLITGPVYDSKGIIIGGDGVTGVTWESDAPAYSGVGYGDPKNGVLSLGTNNGAPVDEDIDGQNTVVMAAASNAKVWKIDADGEIRASSVAELSADNNDRVFWTVDADKSVIDNVYIRVVDEVKGVTEAAAYRVTTKFTAAATVAGITLDTGRINTDADIAATAIKNITWTVQIYDGGWKTFQTATDTDVAAIEDGAVAEADRTLAVGLTLNTAYLVTATMNFTNGDSLTLFNSTVTPVAGV